MKFSIERKRLIEMICQASGKLGGKRTQKLQLKLSACAARVFVFGPVLTAGEEALVLADGECQVRAVMFHDLLKTYTNKDHLAIEADERGLHIERSTVPIQGFSRQTIPPASFLVFPVHDLAVVGQRPSP